MKPPFKLTEAKSADPVTVKVRAPNPHEVLEHAKDFGEWVPQTLREDSIPDYEVGSIIPTDGDPIQTANIKADRSILPIYKPALPDLPLNNGRKPFKLT